MSSHGFTGPVTPPQAKARPAFEPCTPVDQIITYEKLTAYEHIPLVQTPRTPRPLSRQEKRKLAETLRKMRRANAGITGDDDDQSTDDDAEDEDEPTGTTPPFYDHNEVLRPADVKPGFTVEPDPKDDVFGACPAGADAEATHIHLTSHPDGLTDAEIFGWGPPPAMTGSGRRDTVTHGHFGQYHAAYVENEDDDDLLGPPKPPVMDARMLYAQ